MAAKVLAVIAALQSTRFQMRQEMYISSVSWKDQPTLVTVTTGGGVSRSPHGATSRKNLTSSPLPLPMASPRKMRRIWRDCFQPLIERIHFHAHRFEGRHPQQRLAVLRAEDNRADDGLLGIVQQAA